MSKISDQQQVKEVGIQSDVWTFRKKYFNPEKSDAFWSALYEDVESISKKYKSIYVDQLLLVCVMDIERRAAGRDAPLKDLYYTLQIYENLRKVKSHEQKV